ncbi:cation transporter [Pseudanabaena galeata UHCC 0370]|uniref:Cation transporter n=1 Tax=Pseudanabaena galeata UHCC 0370 TaxID=3110310 RepID=A0ABU5TJK2_9CYAN|nr:MULTISPECIES: cation transporter [Pseudanabaena]MEA5478272.1 cation transporter [Pseudanabaena galeata UHCC 0370]MEA5486714.1 cation transporter [Pseudanabaena sp. CCNP1317]WGS73537.1 cation transporter [Pseudanabaena galeata CCNP1313]WGS75179.1 cation transporter [Pseudanabaena galeata CCNP1313]
MSDCGCHMEAKNKAERKTLRILLLLNSIMFVLGIVAGTISHSTALIADALDMFADASVYTISLYAVGKSAHYKNRAATLSGIFQITLAVMVVLDVIRRFVWGSSPESGWMMAIALLSLIVNSYCLYLLSKHRQGEVHMRASWIFTQNDVIANFSVIIAGLLVNLLNSRFPDLIIGLSIASLVVWGGISIIRDSQRDQITQ